MGQFLYLFINFNLHLRTESFSFKALFKLFNDDKYKDFKSALIERFSLEKECRLKDCDKEYIKSNSNLLKSVYISLLYDCLKGYST